MTHILLAETDLGSVKLTTFVLSDAGFRVTAAASGQRAREHIAHEAPDLLLLDAYLPDISGFDLCREVRGSSRIPIIFLARSRTLAERVQGLASGADDYIAKPFEPTELLARITAVLRRYGRVQQASALLVRGPLALDPMNRVAILDGRSIELTPIEARILQVLMSNAGQVVSDQALLNAVWGRSPKGRNLLTVYIYRLRSKLAPAQPEAAPIVTLRGQGYMFMETSELVRERAVGVS